MNNDRAKKLLYGVWYQMKLRCYDKAHKSYGVYGAKGVMVCDEWKDSFVPFYNWAMANGWKEGLQIDKDIKGNGLLYSPATCSIITRIENMNHRTDNRIIEYKGEKKTLSQWQEVLGIDQSTLWSRLLYGWSFEEVIETEIMDRRKPILCIETGETFESVAMASKIKKINRPNIISVLKGNRSIAGGYTFKYLN